MPLLWDCTPNGVHNTSSFTSGIRSAMNTAKWSTVITPTNAFSSYSGFNALIANGNGGLWIVNSQIELYRDEDAAQMISSGTIVNTAGTPITVTVDPVARTLTIAGASGSGNGTYSWAAPAHGTIFSTGDVGTAIYSDGSSYGFAGSVADVQDFVTALSGDSAITLGAATTTADGSVDVSGAAAIVLGALTVLGEDEPGGHAAITLGDLTTSGAGDIEHVGDAAITLGAAAASGTATGPTVWQVGAATVKQWLNADGPRDVTVTSDPISTTTGSIIVVSVQRGYWVGAPDPKAPTDSQGNTWIAVPPGDQGYSTYPDSRFGLWYCVNVAGDAAHTFSITRGGYNDGGSEGASGDEVTIGVVELIGPAMLDSSAHVERVAAATVSSSSVTPSGPSITFVGIAGSGPVGQLHTFSPTSGSTTAGWANVASASANGDPSSSGYIQYSPWVLIDEDGSGTGTAQQLSVNGVSNEGGQFIAAVFQLAAGVLATGGVTLGDATVAGDGTFPMLGDSAITLGSIVVGAGGSIDVSGEGAITLGSVVVGSTSEVDVSGSGAVTLGAAIVAATGELDATGVGAVTLGTLSVAADGSITVVGDSAITLDALSVGGDGTLTPLAGTADGAIVLGALEVVSTGDIPIVPLEGAAAVVLGAVSVFGVGIGPASELPPASTQLLTISTTWRRAAVTVAADFPRTRVTITKD